MLDSNLFSLQTFKDRYENFWGLKNLFPQLNPWFDLAGAFWCPREQFAQAAMIKILAKEATQDHATTKKHHDKYITRVFYLTGVWPLLHVLNVAGFIVGVGAVVPIVLYVLLCALVLDLMMSESVSGVIKLLLSPFGLMIFAPLVPLGLSALIFGMAPLAMGSVILHDDTSRLFKFLLLPFTLVLAVPAIALLVAAALLLFIETFVRLAIPAAFGLALSPITAIKKWITRTSGDSEGWGEFLVDCLTMDIRKGGDVQHYRNVCTSAGEAPHVLPIQAEDDTTTQPEQVFDRMTV